jgi:hypothetical protein
LTHGNDRAALEQFQLESDRKAILKLKKLLAFLVLSASATADDALAKGLASTNKGCCLALFIGSPKSIESN